MNTPDTSSMDYKYGIYARIKRGWTTEQVQMYFDKQGYSYKKSWTKEQLVEELKKWEK